MYNIELSLSSIINWIGYIQFVWGNMRDTATWENMMGSAESFK